jgi:L-fucose/D-arabinose isomerase
MSYEGIDMSEFIRRIEEGIYDNEEFDRALSWVKKSCIEGRDDNNPPLTAEKKAKDWEFIVKMAMIGRDLMIGNPALAKLGFGEEALGHNAIAAGFQGQRQWTDHFPNGDFLETMLTTSFDWNGIRQPYIVATENDYLNGLAMLFGHLLTGTAQIFSDVRTYWSPEAVKRVTGVELAGAAAGGVIHLINSGATCLDGTGCQKKDAKPAIKPFWEITETEVTECLGATRFCPADFGYFRGGGFSTTFETKGGMPVTMSRINWVQGLGPVLQIVEGETGTLPAAVGGKLMERTNPTWPTTWFVPRCTGTGAFRDVYSVMNNWGANHGAISYGHIGEDIITLASMLRIPVYMHNVPEENIFRPSAWNAFGTADIEGADFRACATYGPLYGRK